MSRSIPILAALLAAVALLAGCERPPVDSKQGGYRGTGMEQVSNPRSVAQNAKLHAMPEAPAPASAEGPKAKDIYQNVKVLGDLSVAEFARTMVSITAWVAPEQGCAYCHNVQNMADDGKYTKIVARRMVQMNQHVNVDWKNHVGNTGVTCYTCHRGNNIPANIWFKAEPAKKLNAMLGDDGGQNKASKSVGLSSLPYDPFTPYLLDNKAISDIRVNGPTALPTGNRHSTKQAEHTYALMIHMSSGLGVNCTYCHNTDSFQSWANSPPTRVTAYYGIRMAGELNVNYMTPLTDVFPASRLGALGDVAKTNCATCHQGVNKPLNGAQMAKDYPALLSITPTAAEPAASAATTALSAPAAAPVSAQLTTAVSTTLAAAKTATNR